tara:strand:- start:16069 stop:17325 length:1257 start_codon:yes stop_codon:yes gene_type:complete
LREALARSSFAAKAQIVPGEADDFCGLKAKDVPRSIIFTSDTDLLLFNYHPETLIVLFKDIDSVKSFKAYSPQQIAQKLQLTSLVPFAWVISQRTSEGQNELACDARSVDIHSSLYTDFSQRYTEPGITPTYIGKCPPLELSLQALDVRVFEFVHESLLGSSRITVHLPLLVEDSNQASAWNMAQDIRIFAYSLLAPPASNVHEYRRKAQGISSQPISTYTSTNLAVPAKDVEARMSALHRWAKSKIIDPTLLWTLFALGVVLAELNTPPPLQMLLRVLNAEFDNTWAFLQLTARVQASMYSLRMLKQIIAIRLATNQTVVPGLSEYLSDIDKHMSTFPAIPDMFSVPGQSKRVLAEHGALTEYMKEIYSSAGVEFPVEHVSNKRKKKQAREAERKQKKADQRQQLRSTSSNTFSVLD